MFMNETLNRHNSKSKFDHSILISYLEPSYVQTPILNIFFQDVYIPKFIKVKILMLLQKSGSYQ